MDGEKVERYLKRYFKETQDQLFDDGELIALPLAWKNTDRLDPDFESEFEGLWLDLQSDNDIKKANKAIEGDNMVMVEVMMESLMRKTPTKWVYLVTRDEFDEAVGNLEAQYPVEFQIWWTTNVDIRGAAKKAVRNIKEINAYFKKKEVVEDDPYDPLDDPVCIAIHCHTMCALYRLLKLKEAMLANKMEMRELSKEFDAEDWSRFVEAQDDTTDIAANKLRFKKAMRLYKKYRQCDDPVEKDKFHAVMVEYLGDNFEDDEWANIYEEAWDEYCDTVAGIPTKRTLETRAAWQLSLDMELLFQEDSVQGSPAPSRTASSDYEWFSNGDARIKYQESLTMEIEYQLEDQRKVLKAFLMKETDVEKFQNALQWYQDLFTDEEYEESHAEFHDLHNHVMDTQYNKEDARDTQLRAELVWDPPAPLSGSVSPPLKTPPTPEAYQPNEAVTAALLAEKLEVALNEKINAQEAWQLLQDAADELEEALTTEYEDRLAAALIDQRLAAEALLAQRLAAEAPLPAVGGRRKRPAAAPPAGEPPSTRPTRNRAQLNYKDLAKGN